MVCNPNPCKNKGRCSIVTDKEYRCNCTGTSHTGKDCELLYVEISPTPKLQVNTTSGYMKLKAEPIFSVTVQMYPKDPRVVYNPSNVSLNYFQLESSYRITSSITGLLWTHYKLKAHREKVESIPDSLTFFYNPLELENIPGNSLLGAGMKDKACHQLIIKPHSCSATLLHLMSTSKWSKRSALSNSVFDTNGIVFVDITSRKITFPLIISSKAADVTEFIRDLQSEAFVYMNVSTVNRGGVCRHDDTQLTSGQLQTAVRNDFFAKDFLNQFNSLTPSWFSVNLQANLRYIHRDNIKAYIWSGKRVKKEEACSRATIDESSLFLVYLHHESIRMSVHKQTIDMTTKYKFCFLINLCTSETQIAIPVDNHGRIESLFSFESVKAMGWKISLHSVGFRQGMNDDTRKCAKSNILQIVFGSAVMTSGYSSSKVSGEIYGNMVCDITQDTNGKEVSLSMTDPG